MMNDSEIAYYALLNIAKEMLNNGIISPGEFDFLNKKLAEKYYPKIACIIAKTAG